MTVYFDPQNWPRGLKVTSMSIFSARCNIDISRLCYDVSVRLSVCLWRKCIVVTVHAGNRKGVILHILATTRPYSYIQVTSSMKRQHCWKPSVTSPQITEVNVTAFAKFTHVTNTQPSPHQDVCKNIPQLALVALSAMRAKYRCYSQHLI